MKRNHEKSFLKALLMIQGLKNELRCRGSVRFSASMGLISAPVQNKNCQSCITVLTYTMSLSGI